MCAEIKVEAHTAKVAQEFSLKVDSGLKNKRREQAELEDGEIRMHQQMYENMVVSCDVEEDNKLTAVELTDDELADDELADDELADDELTDDELTDDDQDPDAASNGEEKE